MFFLLSESTRSSYQRQVFLCRCLSADRVESARVDQQVEAVDEREILARFGRYPAGGRPTMIDVTAGDFGPLLVIRTRRRFSGPAVDASFPTQSTVMSLRHASLIAPSLFIRPFHRAASIRGRPTNNWNRVPVASHSDGRTKRVVVTR